MQAGAPAIRRPGFPDFRDRDFFAFGDPDGDEPDFLQQARSPAVEPSLMRTHSSPSDPVTVSVSSSFFFRCVLLLLLLAGAEGSDVEPQKKDPIPENMMILKIEGDDFTLAECGPEFG